MGFHFAGLVAISDRPRLVQAARCVNEEQSLYFDR